MTLPIGVGDVWKIFEWATGKRSRDKQLVGEWLDLVYGDLEELMKVWNEIVVTIETERQVPDIERINHVLDRGSPIDALDARFRSVAITQGMLAGRLRQFYGYASQVLRQKHHQDMHNSFSQALGRLLAARNKARALLDAASTSLGPDSSDMLDIVNQMKSAVVQLQDEAVSLQVLIKTFKAQG